MLRDAAKWTQGFLAISGAALLAAGSLILFDRLADAFVSQMVVLTSSSFVLLCAAVAGRPARSMPILCDPFVLSCIILSQFFIMGPYLLHFQGFPQFLFFAPPQPTSVILTLLVFLAMVVFFVIGNRLRIGVLLADVWPSLGPRRFKLPGHWAVNLVVGVSVVTSLLWIQYGGGLRGMFSTGYGAKQLPPLFSISHRLLIAGTLLLAWRVINGPKRRSVVVALVALLTFDALFFGIFIGARKYLLFLFFGLWTIWLLRRGFKSIPKLGTVVVVTSLLVYFTLWGSVRSKPLNVLLGITDDVKYSKEITYHAGFSTALIGPFGGACKVIELFPDYEPFGHGRTLLPVVLGFIPRAIWPDKPVGLGKEITRYYEGPLYRHTSGLSIAPTALGEFWANFGWAGVLAGGFILGVFCRAVAAYATTGMTEGLQTRAARVLIPAVFVAGLGELRADLGALLMTWALLLAPILLVLAISNLDATSGVPARQPLANRSQRSRSPI